MTWPPALTDVKEDLDIPADDTVDDARLQRRLDAAISFVQRTREDLFITDDTGEIVEPITLTTSGEREEPTIVLGTLMLAGRLFARRRSPDAILWMAETGTTRLPWADQDLARLLRIGVHEKPKVG